MKKLIAVIFLFVFSLFIANSQQKITYVDSLKSVTVSVTSDSKKQVSSIDNLQLRLAKLVESQTNVDQALVNGIATLGEQVTAYTKEIEQRNKNDSKTTMSSFGYSPERVKYVIRVERWLNFTVWILCVSYIVWIISSSAHDKEKYTAPLFLGFVLYHTVLVIGIFKVASNILTILFNGDYYVIKELLNMYT